MTIRAIFFDLGETLFNYGQVNVSERFREGARLSYDYLKEHSNGSARLPAFFRYHVSNELAIRLRYLWSLVVRRDFDCREVLGTRIRSWGFKLTEEQLDEITSLWYRPLGTEASIEPDLPQTLQRLQEIGLQLAIISNTFLPGKVLDEHLQRCGILRFFPVRCYSSETVCRKPDPRIYQYALERAGVSAEESVMVGDRLPEDVYGPQKLGMKGIFKRGLVNQKKKVPVAVTEISQIAELPELIRQWYGTSNGQRI